jgi:hypothetical protein
MRLAFKEAPSAVMPRKEAPLSAAFLLAILSVHCPGQQPLADVLYHIQSATGLVFGLP